MTDFQPVTTEHGIKVGPIEFLWAKNSREFLFANSIYIQGEPSFLIDPSATFTYIESLALARKVDIVFNTHYHGDHRSLNHLFRDILFASNELDAPAIRDYQTYEEYADSDLTSFYTQWRKDFFRQYQITDVPVSLLYKGDQKIKTSSLEFELVHLPGHTPGHTGLYFSDHKILFLADVDLTPFGPWYANVVSNIDDFEKSMAKILTYDADYYVTSHGSRLYSPEVFHKKFKRYQPMINERDQKIADLLKEGPKTLLELAHHGIIYRVGALRDPLKAYFQWQMLQKHLDRLTLQKKVHLDGECYVWID